MAGERSERHAADSGDGELAELRRRLADLGAQSTRHRETHERLLALSQRYEALLAAVPEMIVEVDADKVMRWLNRAARDFYGGDVTGRKPDEFFVGDQPTYQIVQPIFNGDENVIYLESWQRRHDGETRLLAWWCRVLKDSEGQVQGAISTARDITDSRRALELLRESEERFRQLAENIQEVFWIGAPDWSQVLYVSPAYEVIWGRSREELYRDAHAWLESLVVEDRPGVMSAIANRDPRDLAPIIFPEYRIRRPDGSLRWIAARGFPVADPTGRAYRIAGIAEDMTRRKQVEEELAGHRHHLEELVRRRTEELESFSYSVSHDLRAPLRAISGFAQVLLEDHAAALDADAQGCLNTIVRNAAHMSQLIDDILRLSRLGRQEMSLSRIDMTALVREVLTEFAGETAGRALDLRIAEMPPAFGDQALLRQVVTNLLSNALKFTQWRDGAVIELGGWTDSDETIYYVKDNGVGFDMQYADKLFGTFQRLHSDPRYQGTGIGLGIVRRIVDRHGGRVWAKGVPDEGAIFYFALPTPEAARSRVAVSTLGAAAEDDTLGSR
jgi:PAS domain S-box-containing protein